MDDIRLIFVLSEKYSQVNEASEIMSQAFEACKQNLKSDVSWVKEKNFSSLKLNKTDFVVFEDFKGTVFDRLKETKCARILGPWAISICLMEGKAIPNFPWPIYNVAMYGCIVTSSNLPKTVKMEIKEKVQTMGGCYVDNLVEKVTHLVTDNPKSEKYLAAAESGATLMCSSWIDAVWVASQKANVHSNNKEFEVHRCLPFQNLIICCTGLLASKERKDLERMVTDNGGEYSARLNLKKTDILVCSGISGATSEKYKAARKHSDIKCVDVSWITESIKKGYALPHNLFPVKKSTSTPTKIDAHINPDFSVLSAIGIPNTSQRVSVEETMLTNASVRNFNSLSKPGPSKRKGNLREEYGQLVDKLDIKKAKKAGQYLDGCSIYITGFSPEHTEKLCKILNLSGATRYDQFSERVTHVIVGDPKYPEVQNIKSKGCRCSFVSVHWLLDSIDKEQPVGEEKYMLSASDIEQGGLGSPLSKKGLSLLRSNKTIMEDRRDDAKENTVVNAQNLEDDILQQYLKPPSSIQEDDTLAQLLRHADNSNFSNQVQDLPKATPDFKPPDSSMQQTGTGGEYSTETVTEMYFEGLKFLVLGFDEEHLNYIKTIIQEFAGELVPKTYKGIPDYIVVPVFNKTELRNTAKEVVNELFIQQCEIEGCLVSEIQYYHQPFNLPDSAPLENCVITISGYSSVERNFLGSLIEGLGGQHQEQFARVTSEARGVVASTHLVSERPSGKKYAAALKWGLPVVNKDWLLDCADKGRRMPEKDYLVEEGRDSTIEKTTPSKAAMGAISKTATSTNNDNYIRDLENFNLPSTSSSKAKVAGALDPTTTLNSASTSNDHVTTKSMLALNCSQINTLPGVGAGDSANVSGTPMHAPGTSRNSRILTPVNQRLPRTSFNVSNDKPFTQATPVNKIVQQYREGNIDLASDSPEGFRWMGIKTPETPYGACIRADPSPQLRKECLYWINQFPDYVPRVKRLSTPLSEIKRQLWDKILKKGENKEPVQAESECGEGERSMELEQNDQPTPELKRQLFGEASKNEENESRRLDSQLENRVDEPERMDIEQNDERLTPPENTQDRLINNKLQQLEQMLSASGGARRQSRNFQTTIPFPEGNTEYESSQAGTVGWDYTEQEVAPQKVKIFMLSGIADNVRAEMVRQVESLGAAVSELTNYDPSSTHLLCPKPARNEKTLSCMAAGKWILHTSYLEKSLQAGHFLNEEEYEFGNPKSAGNFGVQFDKDMESRMQRMHWWRLEIARRGYGAFNDMRAIVVAQKRDPIIRVIEAGGGVVIDIKPPFDDTVHATHCLLEQRSIRDYADYIPLAQQGVYLLNTVYISDYLHQPNKLIKDCILPYYANYYSRS